MRRWGERDLNPQNTILQVARARPLVPTTVTRDRARRVCHFAIAPNAPRDMPGALVTIR